MPLDPAASVRLVKLLGMTGWSPDAEALAAVRKAGQLVRTAGLTWEDVIGHQAAPASPPALIWREPRAGDHLDAAVCCVYSGAPLTAWDKKFLVSISQRDADLSEKQQRQLDRIVATCREHACYATA